MAMLKFSFLLLVFCSLIFLVNADCDSKEELKFCKTQCNKDRDCQDEPNLNCNSKCKQACKIIKEEFGTRSRVCKQVMLASLTYTRRKEEVPEEYEDQYTKEHPVTRR